MMRAFEYAFKQMLEYMFERASLNFLSQGLFWKPYTVC
jgi:hypothetical protein